MSAKNIIKAIARPLKSQVLGIVKERRVRALEKNLLLIKNENSFSVYETLKLASIYVESLRIKDGSYGRYLYKRNSRKPILYASIFAVLFRHLTGTLYEISSADKQEWIKYIQDHQSSDGLFRDPLVQNEIAETEDWWGWRHLTMLALMALTALGAKPKYKLQFLEKLDTADKIYSFIEKLNWAERASFTSNTLQNYGVFLQYSRDFLGEEHLKDAVSALLDGITEKVDPETGLWGSGLSSANAALSEGVQAGYHFWLLFWYEKQKIPYARQAFKSISLLQNSYGAFNLDNDFASACQDIDAIHPIAKLCVDFPDLQLSGSEILLKSLPWIVSNFNEDGGASFQRHSCFRYGHDLMATGRNESSIFATWFRVLSIGFLMQVLPSNDSRKTEFHFLHCPGLQFPINY
ncbi:hypothetical protein VB780_07380 [Leptolyngbya sp. CCNP1308]|uniref:hypothetical protein n=1 Tax=Leptolyngbya sp. CCNP1308 TaxID=3110255 RepID=UPI002B1FBAB6|nr:hypothetical protein [Leptolyngbya sp. CCNP1308]MEA5448382.1 hypothetical protein [Leptolyngbya sp. CCNP1308]